MLRVFCSAWDGLGEGEVCPSKAFSQRIGEKSEVRMSLHHHFFLGCTLTKHFIRMGLRSLFQISNTLTCSWCLKAPSPLSICFPSSSLLSETIHSTGFSPSSPSSPSVRSRWQLIWMIVYLRYHGSCINDSSRAQLLLDVLQINCSEFWKTPS